MRLPDIMCSSPVQSTESPRLKPFVGCDGEGAGTDRDGKQNYCLLRIGERELYVSKGRLTTAACLDFICQSSRDVILAGFCIDYDVTQILRDVPARSIARLFAPRPPAEDGKQHYVSIWWRDYSIAYVPGKYLAVGRLVPSSAGGTRQILKRHSTRKIHDIGAIFQSSFLAALDAWNIGTPEERGLIGREKLRRSDFTRIGQRERSYCELECRLLADLMEKVRAATHAAGLRPQAWEGAGDLAASMLVRHGAPKRKELQQPPPEVAAAIDAAYYGGRMEISAHGYVPGPVYEADISSAYAAAAAELPCMRESHGEWVRRDAETQRVLSGADIVLARVDFHHSNPGTWCALPVRQRTGVLAWPATGGGWYWGQELRAAVAHPGLAFQIREAWIWHRTCACPPPYEFLHDAYERRQAWGGGAGRVLKLAMAAVYGKLCQHVGNAPWQSLAYAGMIAARTRGRLLGAILDAGGDCVMASTDAIYTTLPASLSPEKPGLGRWREVAEHRDGIFIVQPGLWWPSSSIGLAPSARTRGISRRILADQRAQFERAWADSHASAAPSVKIPVQLFRGLRWAHMTGQSAEAGKWVEDSVEISFAWQSKRGADLRFDGTTSRSLPMRDAGENHPYDPESSTAASASRWLIEADPGYLDAKSLVRGE